MDPDEFLTLAVGSVASLAAALWWYAPLARVYRPSGYGVVGGALALTPPACLAALLVVLQTAADAEVRGHAQYVALFLAAGGAWLGATAVALPAVLGVSVRDDALEGRNGPAAAVASGALTAVTVVFAGANVGAGATIWTTLGPAVLATGGLAGLMLAHAAASGLSEAVTVDRDPAAAARAVGLHLAMAVVLARAVAGDWVSTDALLADLARQGWPAVALAAVAVGVDRWYHRRPWPTRRAVGPGVAWAGVLMAMAVVAARGLVRR